MPIDRDIYGSIKSYNRKDFRSMVKALGVLCAFPDKSEQVVIQKKEKHIGTKST